MLAAAACFAIEFSVSGCAPGASQASPTPLPSVAPTPTTVSGAAPIPLPAPTVGGALPTVVGAPAAVSTPAPEAAATVTISADRQFTPGLVTIDVGQSVRWTNQSRSPHTVTGDPALVADRSSVQLPTGAQSFASAVLNAGDSFVQRFDTAGDYQYVSLPFQTQMVGRVRVRG